MVVLNQGISVIHLRRHHFQLFESLELAFDEWSFAAQSKASSVIVCARTFLEIGEELRGDAHLLLPLDLPERDAAQTGVAFETLPAELVLAFEDGGPAVHGLLLLNHLPAASLLATPLLSVVGDGARLLAELGLRHPVVLRRLETDFVDVDGLLLLGAGVGQQFPTVADVQRRSDSLNASATATY